MVRIRSGSPGLRAGQKPKDLSGGQTFQGEMKQHGMASDLQEIQRFNFVLMSRSTEAAENTAEQSLTQQSKQGIDKQ